MSYRIVEDSELARRNLLMVIGGGGPAYDAVLSVEFSDEGDEVVTLQEAKDWCRIDVSDDDWLIIELIKAARRLVEDKQNLSLIQRTVTAKIHNGLGNMDLPYGPVNGTVSYTDAGLETLTGYDLTQASTEEVYATYQAGYFVLPTKYKIEILQKIAYLYENRGNDRPAQ